MLHTLGIPCLSMAPKRGWLLSQAVSNGAYTRCTMLVYGSKKGWLLSQAVSNSAYTRYTMIVCVSKKVLVVIEGCEQQCIH